MKKTSTPKLGMSLKTNNLQPKKSTIDFILGFAATYEASGVMKDKLPGMILN